ncbi:MAG: ParB/RepB/Spo0J family partition protein [Desulfatiglandales bacterium]
MSSRKALGKGLSALIPEEEDLAAAGSFFQCPVEIIEPNPFQPRRKFGEEEMLELVASVREKGILTPLLVSKAETGYRLIAGERRWRAAQKAGLERVPVVVRETSPVESLEIALIENIHRKDLNPIEEAMAYQRLMEDTAISQETLGKRLGKDRTTITNMLRLLKLPGIIQQDLVEDRITIGHARVLAGMKSAEEQLALREAILKKGLSVRQVEALAKKGQGGRSTGKTGLPRDAYIRSLAETLKRSLGTKVEIARRGKQGRITIFFFSDDELDRLLDRLS